MLGKYFELYQISNPTHVRQYSVCNTAHPSFQVNLLKLMIAKEQNQALKCENFVEKFLSTEDQASVCITVKNYHKGLSQALHESALNTDGWALKGPLGFGSTLVLNAVNYAFVCGTGILPLLD